MLTIYVGAEEHYNEDTREFTYLGGTRVELEHSLVSLSKWESKFEKPFLAPEKKTRAETMAYIQEMIVSPEVSPEIVKNFTQKNFDDVNAYLDAKQTATWFSDSPKAPKTTSELITAELIYYWLVTFNIPWEAQYWHLNRLFTLIKVFSAKSEKPKPMSKGEAAARRRELNAQRKQQYKTSG